MNAQTHDACGRFDKDVCTSTQYCEIGTMSHTCRPCATCSAGKSVGTPAVGPESCCAACAGGKTSSANSPACWACQWPATLGQEGWVYRGGQPCPSDRPTCAFACDRGYQLGSTETVASGTCAGPDGSIHLPWQGQEAQRCEACPQGQYNPAKAQRCQPCPDHSHTGSTGAQTISQCARNPRPSNFSLLSVVACCRCLCDTSYTREGDECKPVVPCVPLSASTTDKATVGGYDLSGCLNLESNGLSCEVKCKQGFTGSSTQLTCPATNWRSQTEASGPEPHCTPCAAGRYKADSVCCTPHPAFRFES